eukprot:1157385-Pelagomonas_calceolata.AAC.6
MSSNPDAHHFSVRSALGQLHNRSRFIPGSQVRSLLQVREIGAFGQLFLHKKEKRKSEDEAENENARATILALKQRYVLCLPKSGRKGCAAQVQV